MPWQFCPSRAALHFETRSKRGTCASVIQTHFGISLALCDRFRSASGRPLRPPPSLAEYSHNAQPIRVRRRSSRRCPKQIKVKHSDKQCQSQRFKVAVRSAWHGATLQNGSSQFKVNLRWTPFRESRLEPMARFPMPPYNNRGRQIRCTCSLATSNGNGVKRPALPGNCCRQRKVRIRIRGLTRGRCWPVPVISAAQARVRQAGSVGSEGARPPRRMR